jgi:Tetracyclin repressor-like, C-terminal domain
LAGKPRRALEAIADEEGSARDRLRRWLDALVAAKRRKALDDPELFATYVALTADARAVVHEHVATLTGQLARIVADGVEHGEIATPDPSATARAVFDATARFHNPVNAAAWTDPEIDKAYVRVRALVLDALSPREPRRRS